MAASELAACFYMRKTTTKRFARTARLLVAGALTLALVSIGSNVATADPQAPSRAALDSAQAKLAALDSQIEVLVEQYNEAKVELAKTKQDLEQAQHDVDQWSGQATAAQQKLDDRTSDAFISGGSTGQVAVLLEANGSFSDFSDRVQFLSALAEQDHAIALDAQNATAKAQMATDALKTATDDLQAKEAELQKTQDEVQKNISEQKALVAKYQIQYDQAMQAYKAELARQRQQEAAAAAAAAAAADNGGGGSGDTSSTGGDGSYNPPPASSAAGTAVAVALDQVGDDYQWGAAGPDQFDCSGLTMYAWGHAGVSLPHSSSSQYASLPHVSQSDLQPGDLLFFYNPIHHVAMYIGGGRMVHAENEQSGVTVSSFSGYYASVFTGAARPG